jgi:hypothetical protein
MAWCYKHIGVEVMKPWVWLTCAWGAPSGSGPSRIKGYRLKATFADTLMACLTRQGMVVSHGSVAQMVLGASLGLCRWNPLSFLP